MRTISQILIWLFFFCLPAISQKQTLNWYFGEKAGITFSNGSPVPLFDGSLSTDEGAASISNKDGDLLFYTNGVNVWNKRHNIMVNGSGLGGDISTTQSAIIIPHPGDEALYYVFAVDYHNGTKGVSYSLINMNLSNGLGAVTAKNISLIQNTTEKITAVHLCNNKDVWIAVRLWNSNLFHSYRIDKNGLDDGPVVSTSPYTASGSVLGKLGSMKLSPDGHKIAAAHSWTLDYVELGKFDTISGSVTDIQKLIVSPGPSNGESTGPYGVEFSSDSRHLYIYAAYGTKGYIYQFDASLATINDIQNSKQLITEIDNSLAGSLQLGIDQKIYVTDVNDSSLSVIHQPNSAGAASNYLRGDLKLGRKSTYGLPNFITSYFRPDFGAGEISATGCGTGTLNFNYDRAGAVISMKWDFGDPSSGAANTSTLLTPSHSYPANGFYTVSLIATRACISDTIISRIYSGNLTLNLNPNYDGCIGDSLELSVPVYPGAKYLWSNGDRTASTKVNRDGKYKIKVTAGCATEDSTEVTFHTKPLFDLGPDISICNNQPVALEIAAPNTQYLWSTGANTSQLIVNNGGVYWGRATNQVNGCSFTDSIFIDDRPFPVLFLGKDTTLCEPEEIILHAGIGNDYPAISLVWQDGSRAASYPVTQPGLYYVTAANNCGTKTDSIRIGYSKCKLGVPNAFTPNGDGHNDRFRPKYGADISKFHMAVFNRVGQLVFESRDQAKGWDGMLAGKPQLSGTYVWMIEYTDKLTGKLIRLKGAVTLIR